MNADFLLGLTSGILFMLAICFLWVVIMVYRSGEDDL